jgi:hypothetical protein
LTRTPNPLLAPLTGAALLVASTAMADTTLPAPYISRALDAVLIPINADVIDMFALYPEDTGVLVLAVQDGGIAAANGIEPGDVISLVSGHAIYEPIDLDTLVYYWISTGVTDYAFDVYRGDASFTYDTVISYESYMEVIEVSSVESWSSYASESFSYSEFYSEYSSEMSESYEYSETTIEETASSEEFASEVDSSSEEMTDESMTDETMTEDAGTDETVDDGTGDTGDVVDDGGDVADDTMDDSTVDDSGADASGGDESGGDDSGGDGE